MILNGKNNVLQDFEGPSPISDFVDTANETTIKRAPQREFLELFDLDIRLADIHIISFEELSKMLFKLANK